MVKYYSIGYQPFDHLFYHFILPYSNWETGTVCFSESFESLSQGLQNAFWQLGAVPYCHRTDSLSAAVNNLSNQEQFTARYLALCQHYKILPKHSNAGKAHEQGSVEQSHYRFKKAVEQELILRGSRDFENRQDYERFLFTILKRRNASRIKKLKVELDSMQALPLKKLEDCTRQTLKVSKNSTISVQRNIYSLPSQLIGEQVDVKIWAETIEVFYSGTLVEKMPRSRGKGHHSINYRHVIHSLVRKPRAFANYRYQQDMFPRLVFRLCYDYLLKHYPASADKQYLQILFLAAQNSEEQVANMLQILVEQGQALTQSKVFDSLKQETKLVEKNSLIARIKAVQVSSLELSIYDNLIMGVKL